jgi:amino acid transporter
MTTADPSQPGARKFGTFGGVFVPNVLTILGVILFLRAGWVVGQAGLRQALIILCIANGITLLTALSLSAIATNTRVGGGGAYFLISRSLGLEIGGSIGLPLYLAQAISVAFYIIGFVESLGFLWPGLDLRATSSVVLGALFIIAWVGADLAIKTQYLILACLALSLVSFFAGWHPVPDWRETLQPDYGDGHTFWSVFAIFFPAVTGIMSGVSMSGDLRNPSRSIPRGTVWAVIVTFLIYATQMVWLAVNGDRHELLANNLAMRDMAFFGPLIFVGLWAATLSSALASLLAAPRTLQALGQDGVMPRFLARGSGAAREPKIALALTVLLVEACLYHGDLNFIAPVISMFFLATYGSVNLVAGLERWVHNPSYRPTFRVHWLPSLAGAAGCLFVMLVINPLATVVAVVLIFGIYSLLKRRQYRTAWGDVRSGFWFAITRLGLLQLSATRAHVRNWRPVLLVMVGNPKSRLGLVEFARCFEARRGLIFLAQVLTGQWQNLLKFQASQQKSLEDFIRDNRLSAVAKTVLADDFEHGVSTLLQVSGVGSLQPNTVLMGWSDDVIKQSVFGGAIRRILQLHTNLLVFSESGLPAEKLKKRIDVWWRAKENGSFMLTLAHLLQVNPRFRDHKLRVMRIIAEEGGRAQAETATRKMLEDARLPAECTVIVSREPPFRVIATHSEKSDVCFVGVALRLEDDSGNPLDACVPLVAELKGNVFLAKSWHDLEL